ncbi:MAG: chemoreceptor glutamine deamidase CheD [Lysobacterales bacterium]
MTTNSPVGQSALSLPPALPDSGEAQRFVNKNTGNIVAKVLPGFFYVTRHAEQIMTVLGSCVAACIRDPIEGIGGLNHFMLPMGSETSGSAGWGSGASAENRYGNFAMENLINALVKNGAVKSRLEVKLFGGGRVLDISMDVGSRNARFAQDYLQMENLSLTASDVGGDYARKVIFNPITGKARMKRLQEVYNGYVVSQEKQLMESLESKPVEGSVELF